MCMCLSVFVCVGCIHMQVQVPTGKDIVAPGSGITLDYELLCVHTGN